MIFKENNYWFEILHYFFYKNIFTRVDTNIFKKL